MVLEGRRHRQPRHERSRCRLLPHPHRPFGSSEAVSPLQALQTATLNPARVLDRTQDFGPVAIGKVADLVLLDANPLDDITNTSRIATVVVKGKLYQRPDLDRLLQTALRVAEKN